MATSIDPRLAELLGHDEHLPPVDLARLSPQALIQRFQTPPAWKPDIEVERWFVAPNPVAASVLVPLVMRPSPTVLLTLRTAHLNKHAGQISFPGGRCEPSDANAVFTALREAEEEIGLSPARVQVLGSMPTYTTGTGFVVTPVVGLIEPASHELLGLDLQADANEVQSVFEVPLAFLMNPRHHQRRAFEVPSQVPGDAPVQVSFFAMPWRDAQSDDQERMIWGATAAMLRNLYRFLAA